MQSPRPQRGLASAAIVIVLILTVLALVLGRGYFQGEAILGQRGTTDANLRRISDALVDFAALNGRLPCPAPGNPPFPINENEGKETTSGTPTTCTNPDGVVPWVTLGLRRSDGADAWGGKLSYRVYAPAGGTDGFTRLIGVNATSCSTEVAVGGESEVVVDCAVGSHVDHPVHFLRAFPSAIHPVTLLARKRGLVVDDRGTTNEGLAFILISHGQSGRGAFGAETHVRTVDPVSDGERRNTQGPSSPPWDDPFIVDANSGATVPPDHANHFDDIVSYMAASELISRAKLGARAWPSSGIEQSYISDLVPGAISGQTYNLGQPSLAFGRVTITATSSVPGQQNIGFRLRDGTAGIGVVPLGSTSGGSISSTNNEVLVLNAGAGSTFQKVDIALNELQTRTSWPYAKERVELSVWRTPSAGADPVLVQASTIESWHIEPGPSLCLLESIPGTIFDRMEIRPLVRSDGGSSTVTLAAIKACSNNVDTCEVVVPDADAQRCLNRPPGAATTAATAVGMTTATLNGTVDDNGAALSAISFQYGLTTTFGSTATATPSTLAADTGVTTVTANLTGLTCNTTYYYRTRAVSAGGTTVANDASFKTAACT